jgi:hypothetical protein
MYSKMLRRRILLLPVRLYVIITDFMSALFCSITSLEVLVNSHPAFAFQSPKTFSWYSGNLFLIHSVVARKNFLSSPLC